MNNNKPKGWATIVVVAIILLVIAILLLLSKTFDFEGGDRSDWARPAPTQLPKETGRVLPSDGSDWASPTPTP